MLIGEDAGKNFQDMLLNRVTKKMLTSYSSLLDKITFCGKKIGSLRPEPTRGGENDTRDKEDSLRHRSE